MQHFSNYFMDSQRHLICIPYSVDNLHKMANELGIKKCWFHNSKYPHYDIPKKRVAELKKLVNVVSPKELLRLIKNEKTR